MKKTTVVLLSIATLFALNGCGLETPSSSAEKTYSKTPAEIWTQSCHKCHGENAEGLTEKKTPPMNDRQAGELELDLYDVKNDGITIASGTEHDEMGHNMQKLVEKGFDYDPKAMAEYIEKNFYKFPPKKASTAEAVEIEKTPAMEETPAVEETSVTETPEAETPEEEETPAVEETPEPTEN